MTAEFRLLGGVTVRINDRLIEVGNARQAEARLSGGELYVNLHGYGPSNRVLLAAASCCFSILRKRGVGWISHPRIGFDDARRFGDRHAASGRPSSSGGSDGAAISP